MNLPLTVYSNSNRHPISVRKSMIVGEHEISKLARTKVGLFASPSSGFPIYLN